MQYILYLIIAGIVVALIIDLIKYLFRSSRKKKYDRKLNAVGETAISSGFSKTKSAGVLCIDEVNKKWWVVKTNAPLAYYNYEDILDYELVVDGEKHQSQNGVSRAIAGGLLFGGVGALVGANTAKTRKSIKSMYINVMLKGGDIERIPFINSETKVDSSFYNMQKDRAERATAMLANMVYEAQQIELPQKTQQNYNENNTPFSSIVVESKDLYTYTKIVGVTQNSDTGVPIQSILPKIPDGALLELRREPDNPFDENAIMVLWSNNRIGYISRDLAADISPLIDSGQKAIGRVEGITGGGENTFGCNISIYIISK